jgi:hypothetical protein
MANYQEESEVNPEQIGVIAEHKESLKEEAVETRSIGGPVSEPAIGRRIPKLTEKAGPTHKSHACAYRPVGPGFRCCARDP